MRTIEQTGQFKRDYKRDYKREAKGAQSADAGERFRGHHHGAGE